MSMCARPKASVAEMEEAAVETKDEKRKEKKTMIMVGKPAPMFKAPAYHNGEFKEINLEDYLGKWVMLCFYPGDFTFV